jgi:hypothetical protein
MKYTLDNDELQEAINVLITAHKEGSTSSMRSILERYLERLLAAQCERVSNIVQK